MFLKNSQKGITLFLVIIILAVVLAVAIGLSAILVGQIKMIAGMGNSVKALYAADTGIEEALVPIMGYLKGQASSSTIPDSINDKPLENEAHYWVKIGCCDTNYTSCQDDCPPQLSPIDGCNATRFCIRSIGAYKDVQRAIEVSLEPPID